ncbi:MAG: T9SS type A sorting domain-containing protein [Chitinophagales bacterium]|nr:T9SS type A sorting domain-containing protein [Chitinophagales bacterium]
MQKLLLPVIAICFSVSAYGQEVNGKVYKAELAGTTVFRDVDNKYGTQVFGFEAPEPDGDDEQERLDAVKEEIARLYPHKMSNARQKTTSAKDPVVVKSYVANTTPGTPPDNDFAVSKADKAVSVINVNAAIMDASTGTVNDQKSLGFFSGSAGLGLSGRYDPKVLYDAKEDRFICVMLHDRDENNYIVVGFSQSNDPTGAWAWYKFYGDYGSDSTWFDYPGVSVTNSEFFFTGNKIKYAAPWETGFRQSVIYQVNKSDGYSGASALTYKIWDGIKYDGNSIRNLFPVRPGWLPTGDEQYFLSNRNFSTQNDSIFLVKVPGTISQGGSVSVTLLKSPLSYGVPPNGRQEDTSATLATNDGRILGAYVMNNEIQFVSTSVDPNNGASGVFHAKITDYATSPNISYAQIFSIDTLDFGYPNISYVGNPWGLNQSIISFNYTGPSTPAGIGALVYDGLSYSNMLRAKEGESSISGQVPGKVQRWGDYTGTQVDYNNLGSVWIEGIYGRSDHEYGSWIVKLNSPALGVKETIKKATGQVYPNPVNTFVTYMFTLSNETEVTFAIYNINGQLVDNLVTKKCEEGKNVIQFNTASLPAGSYILRGSGSKGDVVMTQRFVKQ